MLDRRKQKKPSIDRARGKRTSIGENVRGETCRRDSRREEEGKKGEEEGEEEGEKKGREAVMRLAITLPNWTRSTEEPSGQNYKIPPRASTFRTRGEKQRERRKRVQSIDHGCFFFKFSNESSKYSAKLHFLIKIFFFELERIHRSISIKLLSLHEPSNFAHVNY